MYSCYDAKGNLVTFDNENEMYEMILQEVNND